MSLIIAMGELMMYGAVAGGAAGALISSTKGVNDAM